MLNIFSTKDKDEKIKELEAEIIRLQRICQKRQCRIQRLNFFVEEFKKFSPRLWFEYFSPDAGKFSAAKKAEARYQKWLDEGNHLKDV